MHKLFWEKRSYHTVEPLCNAVEQLSNVLRSEHVQRLMTKFSKMHSSIPNFRIWLTYVDMVELLLELIRAERDDNWTQSGSIFCIVAVTHNQRAYKLCQMRMYVFLDMKLLEKTRLTHPSSWKASWLSDVW